MMPYVIYIFAICLLVISSSGQSPKQAEDWRIYSPTAQEFSVDAPLLMQRLGGSIEESQRYSVEISGVYLYAFSDEIHSKGYFETVREALVSLGQSRDLIPMDSSMPVSFRDPSGYWHTLKTLKTDARIYVAQTITLDEKSEIASRFIGSFVRGDQPSIIPKPKPTNRSSNEKPVADKTESKTVGTASGNTALGGTSQEPFTPPASNYTSGLEILSKPRPGYTDLARIYGIQGTVIVEVTFLSSGEVGTITPVKQLPLGLTQNTINAAKRVAFQPAYENGVPITVTKKLEYSYAIY